jgi:hypothetical protein
MRSFFHRFKPISDLAPVLASQQGNGAIEFKIMLNEEHLVAVEQARYPELHEYLCDQFVMDRTHKRNFPRFMQRMKQQGL